MEGQHIPSGMYRVTQVGKKEVRYKRKNQKSGLCSQRLLITLKNAKRAHARVPHVRDSHTLRGCFQPPTLPNRWLSNRANATRHPCNCWLLL